MAASLCKLTGCIITKVGISYIHCFKKNPTALVKVVMMPAAPVPTDAGTKASTVTGAAGGDLTGQR